MSSARITYFETNNVLIKNNFLFVYLYIIFFVNFWFDFFFWTLKALFFYTIIVQQNKYILVVQWFLYNRVEQEKCEWYSILLNIPHIRSVKKRSSLFWTVAYTKQTTINKEIKDVEHISFKCSTHIKVKPVVDLMMMRLLSRP